MQEFGLFDASPIVLNAAHGGAGRDFANAVALVESDARTAGDAGAPQSASSAISAAAAGGAGARACSTSTSSLWSGGKFRSRR